MSRIRGNSVNIATKMILEKIENYDFLSGDVVSDLELSKQFNMSRTPIREAIMSLVNEGVLERTQTRIVVKAITFSDIVEILEVRDAIEQKSAEIIIEKKLLKADYKQQLLEIQNSLAKNIAEGNFDKNFNDDNQFHKKIIEYSGNSCLIKFNQRLALQSKRLIWISMLTPSRYTETIEEHKVIMNNLLSNNLKGTKLAIHNHLINTQSNYETILNNSQWDKIAHEIKIMKGEEQAI